ncbi:MAG: ACT domain-containing protein [Janthinobacterium lividum]
MHLCALRYLGLTAAATTALAAAGISCNGVAAVYHDHLFVPLADAARALHTLHPLQRKMQGAPLI